MQKAWFLDRDGTIIEDKHYLKDPEDIVVLDRVVQALQEAQKAGYLLIFITNQSGIARGFFLRRTQTGSMKNYPRYLRCMGLLLPKAIGVLIWKAEFLHIIFLVAAANQIQVCLNRL